MANKREIILLKWLSVLIVLVVSNSELTSGHITEIIVNESDNESPLTAPELLNVHNTVTRSGVVTQSPEEFVKTCSVEYNVIKKEKGKCIRLGSRGLHTCVSDNYVVPFHGECM